MDESKKDVIKVFSFAMIAFLLSKGLQPVDRGKIKTKIYYEFERNDELERLIREYKQNKELSNYIRAFSEVKKFWKENR